MSGKRKGRAIKLMVQWHGRTVGNRREAVCWMCIYDLKRGQRHAISFVVNELDQLRAGDPMRLAMLVEQRWRSTWLKLRDWWRSIVLGTNWRARRALITRKRYALQQWDRHEGLLFSFAWHREQARREFVASLEREWGPTPAPVYPSLPEPVITGVIRNID